jgi:hypothetical protein
MEQREERKKMADLKSVEALDMFIAMCFFQLSCLCKAKPERYERPSRGKLLNLTEGNSKNFS